MKLIMTSAVLLTTMILASIAAWAQTLGYDPRWRVLVPYAQAARDRLANYQDATIEIQALRAAHLRLPPPVPRPIECLALMVDAQSKLKDQSPRRDTVPNTAERALNCYEGKGSKTATPAPANPNDAFPNITPGRDATPEFAQELTNCLSRIQQLAAADPSSRVNVLLNELRRIPITVLPRPRRDTSNVTLPSSPGKPVNFTWSSTESGTYSDGASKIPCATMLHELTHAWENYNGYDNGEIQAVRAENWFIWKVNRTQRKQYEGTLLPDNQVIWPQAARSGQS